MFLWPYIYIWLVVWNMNFLFSIIFGMSSFPLTHSIIFRYCTTNQLLSMFERCLIFNHAWDMLGSFSPLTNILKGDPRKDLEQSSEMGWDVRNGVIQPSCGHQHRWFSFWFSQRNETSIFESQQISPVNNFQKWSSICWPGQYQLGKYT